jgi:phenylacetate-coenzyme A ligase PaaK-like adenylate-forming protein
MYWFGKKIDLIVNWKDTSFWEHLPQKKLEFSKIKSEEILSLLDQFSREDFSEALPEVIKESGFSREEAKKTLDLLPTLLKRESLEKRLRAEFNRAEVLDQFTKLPHGNFKVRAMPKGILLHVTAGNVFLSSIDSLLMGLLTKNLSILKVSSQNQFFPLFFAEKLKAFDRKNLLSDKFAVVHWKGGDQETESFIKNKVNAILAWGGEEMISSYAKNLSSEVKLLDFGPKISLQVVTKKGLLNRDISKIAEKVVADIIPWDQGACASPQNLYLEEGIDEELFLESLDKAFRLAPPRGLVDEDEATELLKETYRAYYSELMGEGSLRVGPEHLIHLEDNNVLRPSPLHRSLVIKRFKSFQNLREILSPFSYYLQSCSYLLGSDEKDQFLDELSVTGLKRFAPLGTITWGMEGAPHDGRFVLRELVNFIGDESRVVDYGETSFSLHDSKSIKTSFESTPHPKGYIFSSGGTTGEPKFVHFSYEEFDYMSDMLAENFRAQGLRPGMTVANLFVAGNLWSSFLCVEKALEKIGAIQLPIGGMCALENIASYLKKFSPDVVMGIPSMLVMVAEFMAKQELNIQVPKVFFAGEALSHVRQDYLKEVWGTAAFSSAGYASVDAGVIGYQCPHSKPGEHHVFSDMIDLQIIDGEAIVTSLARNSMPIVHYRTGDKIEWISDCFCGRSDKRFKLLGRVDNTIHIWSCRLLLQDIEDVIEVEKLLTFQVKIREERRAQEVQEKITIALESNGKKIDSENLLLALYERSRDVKDTIPYDQFKKNVNVEWFEEGKIPRNPRTGKISLILDERK